MKLGILGCGNWGSVFGIMQHRNGHKIKLWEFDRERAELVSRTRDNRPFLQNHKIPSEIKIDWRLENIITDVDLVVIALPSQVLGSVMEQIIQLNLENEYLILTKGIDIKTLKRPSEIVATYVNKNKIFVLSGPCIANEIIRGEPTAVVIVGKNQKRLRELQHQLTTENFRIYCSNDMIGVELGAAIKNVIAIGSGICAGLGFGNNAKGALITRGIVEMQRLGVKLGARARTFFGLSGLGDLITTAFSEESRNHRLGKMLGQGLSLEQAQKKMVMVAEGVPTARALKKLSELKKIEMPICEVVYEILYKNKSPLRGMRELMARELKDE